MGTLSLSPQQRYSCARTALSLAFMIPVSLSLYKQRMLSNGLLFIFHWGVFFQ